VLTSAAASPLSLPARCQLFVTKPRRSYHATLTSIRIVGNDRVGSIIASAVSTDRIDDA